MQITTQLWAWFAFPVAGKRSRPVLSPSYSLTSTKCLGSLSWRAAPVSMTRSMVRPPVRSSVPSIKFHNSVWASIGSKWNVWGCHSDSNGNFGKRSACCPKQRRSRGKGKGRSLQGTTSGTRRKKRRLRAAYQRCHKQSWDNMCLW